MTRKALLIVDMLVDFLDPKGALYCGDDARKIIPQVRELIREHRNLGSLIIFVADHHAPQDKEFDLFPNHCVDGSPGAEMIPEIEVHPEDTLIYKIRYSAFFGTELEETLRRENIKEVHICGVCTSICVMDTTSDLWNRDYTTVVHASAVADFDPEAHVFALKRMKNILGARIEN